MLAAGVTNFTLAFRPEEWTEITGVQAAVAL